MSNFPIHIKIMDHFKFLSVVFFTVYILLKQHGAINLEDDTTHPDLAVLYRRGDIHIVREILHVTLTAHIVSECELSVEQNNITKSEPAKFKEEVEDCFKWHKVVMSVVENVAREGKKTNVSLPETTKRRFINATEIIRTFSWAKPELNFHLYIRSLGYRNYHLEDDIDQLTHILVRALDYDRMICDGNCRSDLAIIQSYHRSEESHLPYADTFTFDIIFPVVDPHVLSVSLDPFTLVREVELPCTGNGNRLYCKWKYNGPISVLVDVNNSDCVLRQFWNDTGKTWLAEESLGERHCVKWTDIFNKSTLTCYQEDLTIPTEKKRLDHIYFYNCPRRREFPCCRCDIPMQKCPDEVFSVSNYDYDYYFDGNGYTEEEVVHRSLMNMNFTQPEIPWPNKGRCDRVGIARFIIDYYYKY